MSAGRRSASGVPGNRALSPVVGKALELGIVVLFVALLTTTLYGGVVPDYRTTAAAEVGERTVVGAVSAVEDAVPERTVRVDRRVSVSLPATIRGDPYRIRAVPTANDTGSAADGSATTFVLDHPDGGVGGRATLSLPARGATVTGTWRSTSESWVVVRQEGRRVAVTLANGAASLLAAGAPAGRVEPTGGTP